MAGPSELVEERAPNHPSELPARSWRAVLRGTAEWAMWSASGYVAASTCLRGPRCGPRDTRAGSDQYGGVGGVRTAGAGHDLRHHGFPPLRDSDHRQRGRTAA
ncbi:hypothetical protein E6W17_30245 [Streptomyces sp. A1547]|nr:hypothetical protein E6W17_30245 [Streptomyces sp. A1547]